MYLHVSEERQFAIFSGYSHDVSSQDVVLAVLLWGPGGEGHK